MQKKSLVILSLAFLMGFVFIASIFAQDISPDITPSTLTAEPTNAVEPATSTTETETSVTPTTEEDKVNTLVEEAKGFDEKLSVGPGITPDSPLSFIDAAFDGFANPADVRVEKIAEMKTLSEECGQGDERACEFMKKSFERYQKYANNFERDVSPDQRDKALESSKAIRGVAIREIAQNMPAGEKDEFVREIVAGEKDIETAAEIASRIFELCSQLSKLDPSQYSKVCRVEGDAPDWRKELDADLTEEQRTEALKFGEIMSQCFETAGQQCKCEEIAYPDFAETCSIAAPLVTACDIEKNEEACNKLDNLKMPELPEHLQDIMDNLESEMDEGKYGMFLPRECQEAGATSPEKCSKIMIQTHAPEECKQALLDANVQSEREGRAICEKIMFANNAPSECIDAGIINPEECGKLMFRENAPEECIDAGLDGSDRNDPTACRKLMESHRGQEGCAPGTDCSGPGGYARGTGPNMKSSGGNCQGISDSQERLACYDGAGKYVQEFRDDFKENFNKIDRPQFDENNPQEFENKYPDNFRQDFNQDFAQQYSGDFKDGQMMSPEEFQQPGTFTQPPTETQPSTTTSEPAPSTTTTESAPVTGGVIANSRFLRWLWG